MENSSFAFRQWNIYWRMRNNKFFITACKIREKIVQNEVIYRQSSKKI